MLHYYKGIDSLTAEFTLNVLQLSTGLGNLRVKNPISECFVLKMSMKAQWDGSVDKDHQDWWPKFNPQNSQGGREHQFCKLFSVLHLHAMGHGGHMHKGTHIKDKKWNAQSSTKKERSREKCTNLHSCGLYVNICFEKKWKLYFCFSHMRSLDGWRNPRRVRPSSLKKTNNVYYL